MVGLNSLFTTGLCVLWLAVAGPVANTVQADSTKPRVYDFLHNDAVDLGGDLQRYGSVNQVDYFRLLEVDGDHLIIGAADSVHNISIDKFERISLYEWKPGANESNDCFMKSIEDPSSCRNYIRVLSRDKRNGFLLICGTNSFKPLCRIVDTKNATVLQFDGVGMSPFNPKHNTTFYREGDFLYTATVTDFAGDDFLIYRKNISQSEYGIRTEQYNKMQLNKPQFVGALNSEKYVYFFFREIGTEASETVTYSRVARVCKNDMGGPSNYKYQWTSFVKMRLNCSIPEKNRRFYFDEIISISNVTRNSHTSGRGIVYATFVSEFDFLRYSVVCAFDLNKIDELFAVSDYITFDQESHRYVRRKRNDLERTAKLGQCHNNSTQLDDEDFIALRKNPLLADSAPNIFGRAVGIHRGSDNYNQIVVLEGVQTQDGQVDVLYVGTDQGNVIKMVNLVDKNSTWNLTTDIDSDPMHQIAVFKVSELPIRRLLIAKNKYLIVVTDPVVYRLPLHFCSSHTTCEECIGIRDPHCSWHQSECTSVKNVKQKFVYQDMLQKHSKICDEARSVEKPKVHELKTSTVRSKLRLKDEHWNSTLASCDCHSKDAIVRSKCNCPSDQPKAVAHIVSQFPMVSNEVEHSKSNNWSLWIGIGLLVVLIQSGALIILYCKYRSKRRKAKKASVTLQMPKTSVQSVINAYCPTTLTDVYGEKPMMFNSGTMQLKHGKLRQGVLGEVSVQLTGNTAPSVYGQL